jgi:hypothetical protein
MVPKIIAVINYPQKTLEPIELYRDTNWLTNRKRSRITAAIVSKCFMGLSSETHPVS